MRGDWPYEIVRILENWSMWVQNDRRPVGMQTYPAYQLAARGKRVGNVVPVLGVEAERADTIITVMSPRWQQPLRMHYMWITRTDESRARSCNCSVNTYKERLEDAHHVFAFAWYQRNRSKVLTVIDSYV